MLTPYAAPDPQQVSVRAKVGGPRGPGHNVDPKELRVGHHSSHGAQEIRSEQVAVQRDEFATDHE